MSNSGSFTATFTVLEGAPLKKDFNASEFSVDPNAPPKRTYSISAYEKSSTSNRTFRFTFSPELANGTYELEEGQIETYFAEEHYGFSIIKSSLTVTIDSISGIYTGTFRTAMLDRYDREVIANGKFDLKVIPN